jgi:hypothetical protein
VDGAGVLRQGLDLGDAVLVGGGASEHVQVPVAELVQRRGPLPVPVGGVGLADLGDVPLQRGLRRSSSLNWSAYTSATAS